MCFFLFVYQIAFSFFLVCLNCLNLNGSRLYSSCWRRASNGRSNGSHHWCSVTFVHIHPGRTGSAAVFKHETLPDVPETGFVSPQTAENLSSVDFMGSKLA